MWKNTIFPKRYNNVNISNYESLVDLRSKKKKKKKKVTIFQIENYQIVHQAGLALPVNKNKPYH